MTESVTGHGREQTAPRNLGLPKLAVAGPAQSCLQPSGASVRSGPAPDFPERCRQYKRLLKPLRDPRYRRRRKRVRQWLEEESFEILVVASRANVRYLSGFSGEGMLAIGTVNVLSTDHRYEMEAYPLAYQFVTLYHCDGHMAGIIDYLKKMGVSQVAFESEHLTYAQYEDLSIAMERGPVIPCERVVEELRMVKDKREVELIARAAAITDSALEQVARHLKPGVTERQIARKFEDAVLAAGADKPAFAAIVAFGPSAASPHAVPTDRKLERGQVVLIDCGAMVEGYCADITRTYMIGKPDEQFRKIYNVVYEAQQAALAAAKPGMRCVDLDAVARNIIREHGFGEDFLHSLGHGVGLEVHELPRVSQRSRDILKPGVVITIEPGVYIAGWGGVRIEDTVLITRRGAVPLTRAPKQGPW